MNYRTNEDQRIATRYNNYNLLINVEDLSEDSGPVIEPATLQEVKDYLRLEGFGEDNSGIVVQEPTTVTLAQGSLTATNAALIGQVIVSLSRESSTYTQALTPGNLQFSFDNTTGLLTFNTVGDTGGETLGIVFGTPAENATADAFNYDDDLIEDMITEARMWLEKYTGMHFVPKRLQVTFCNGNGYIELPGPVQGAITITGDITTAEYIGTQFPKVKTIANEIVATYAAGYNYGTAPLWVKNAIKAYVCDHYEYRGDDAPPAANKRAGQIARPHRRNSAWA